MPQSLLLFDIDGTLVTRSTAHRAAFHESMRAVYGIDPSGSQVKFHGMTDPQIVIDVCLAKGLSRDAIMPKLDACMRAMEEAYERQKNSDSAQPLPGVVEFLDACVLCGCFNALVTGNLERIAYSKLGRIGLANYFACGGFGSDHTVRSELVALAIGRAKKKGFCGSNVWVIGDTPNDIAAAKANGIPCLCVATGAFAVAALQEAGATVVAENLLASEEILRKIGVEENHL